MQDVTADELLDGVARSAPRVLTMLWHVRCHDSESGMCKTALQTLAEIVERERDTGAVWGGRVQLVVCTLQTESARCDTKEAELRLRDAGLPADPWAPDALVRHVTMSFEEKERLKSRHPSFRTVPHVIAWRDGVVQYDGGAACVEAAFDDLVW
jgi:hypothetical protein